MSQERPNDPHHGWSDAVLDAKPVVGHRTLRRLGWAVVVILVLVLLAVLPPLINVGRYQRRITQDISASIGRPVHFDEIQLHLLPLPGLTIRNFVMQEEPAFGTEPAMRANSVEARLRLASLWRRRIEISRIDLKSPSINLVRNADGRWNFQGVVSQAGTIASAPTAQRRAGTDPRFPYIEASDARINIKLGETKLPWSVVDADLALWLPEATEWRVRLRGRPLRTDTDVSDVGELHVEGSLGRDMTGRAAGLMQQPLALSLRWSSTPLGEAAKLLLGRDTGFRGAASAEMEVRGTPATMQLQTDLHLHNLRRADFVPRLPMSVNAHCIAGFETSTHSLHQVRCAIPTAQSAGLFDGMFRASDDQVMNAADVLALQGDVPDLTSLRTARATLVLQRGNPGYVLDWLRVASSRIPENVSATGTVSLRVGWNTADQSDTASTAALPSYTVPSAAQSPAGSTAWFVQAKCSCTLQPAFSKSRAPDTSTAANPPWSITLAGSSSAAALSASGSGTAANASPKQITVAAAQSSPSESEPQPALDREADASAPEPGTRMNGTLGAHGVTLSYQSVALAQYAASLLPPLGDNLPAPAQPAATPGPAITSTLVWGQPQTWTETNSPTIRTPSRRRPRHSR